MPRSQRELPADHPLKDYTLPENTDCVSDVPVEVLDKLVEYYEGQEPEAEPVPEDEELV